MQRNFSSSFYEPCTSFNQVQFSDITIINNNQQYMPTLGLQSMEEESQDQFVIEMNHSSTMMEVMTNPL